MTQPAAEDTQNTQDTESSPHPTPGPVKVTGPMGLVGSVPYLLGFHPKESLVLLCMRGPRRHVGPTVRLDLPTGESTGPQIASYLAAQAARFATAVALICYTGEADGRLGRRAVLPRTPLVRRCLAELRNIGVPVLDAMLVRDGLVWSYLRHKPDDDGCRLPDPDDPRLGDLPTLSVVAGRAVLASRETVAASIAGPVGSEANAATDEFITALDRFGAAIADLTYQQTVAYGCQIAQDRLEHSWEAHRNGGGLDPALVADLLAAMIENNVRDVVISWAFEHLDDQPLPLFIELARRTPDELAVQLCTVLAVVSYRNGDGALAQLALDRVLAVEPTHRLALMMAEIFDAGTRPEELDILIIAPQDHPANPEAPIWQRGARAATVDQGE